MSVPRLLLGTRKGLFVLHHEDRGWEVARVAHPGIPVAYAFEDARTGTLWASLDHGHWGAKLSRSRDGGETWEEVPAPTYPEGEEVAPGKPATLEYIWVIAPGGEDHPERLYLGTNPGGLFRSDDGGDSFALVRGLWDHPSRGPQHWFGGGRDTPGIHSIVVDPRDSERVLVGISCAGVFETTDGGASWSPRNRGLNAEFLPDPTAEVGHDPHCVVACASQPDVLWQQNHCGIFRSTDGGASWTAISEGEGPAHFGFGIVAHPEDPDSAWVVPAKSDANRAAWNGRLLVCRTRDGGRSWASLTDGLPQRHAYDLVLRHAVDGRGERVAFGSTTGNVFASEDGERFTCVGTHFPPVYSVRFAP